MHHVQDWKTPVVCLHSIQVSHSSPFQAIVNFDISPTHDTMRKLNVTAVVVPATCFFIQSSLTPNGSTYQAYISSIHSSVIQAELISFWEWKSSLKSCIKVSGTDLQSHPSQFKLSLAGFLQGRSVYPLPHRTSHLTMLQSPLMRYCRSFGKLRRIWRIMQISPLKREWRFNTFQRIIAPRKTCSPSKEATNQAIAIWACWNSPYVQRENLRSTLERSLCSKGNSRSLTQWSKNTYRWDTLRRVPFWTSKKTVEQVFYLPTNACCL